MQSVPSGGPASARLHPIRFQSGANEADVLVAGPNALESPMIHAKETFISHIQRFDLVCGAG